MKKFKVILMIAFACLLTFSTVFALGARTSETSISAAELTDAEKVQNDINSITYSMTARTRAIASFVVPTVSVYGNTITWASSNSDVLDATHVTETGGWIIVNRPTDEDKTVTLTVTVTKGDVTQEASFPVLVPKGITITKSNTITYVSEQETENNNPIKYNSGTYVELTDLTKMVIYSEVGI